MSRQNRISLIVMACFFTQGFTSHVNSEMFVIDASHSRYSYTSSPWFDTTCNHGCQYSLSGSFEGSLGNDLLTITRANLSFGDERASHVDTTTVHRQFPKSARVANGEMSHLNDQPVFAFDLREPVLVAREGGFRLFAGRSGALSDGESFLFDVAILRGSELDCNADVSVDFTDAACTQDASKLAVLLDWSDSRLGDLNGNGEVGFDDFLVVSKNFGAPGNYMQGDINLDGKVGFGDFLILSGNFGDANDTAVVAVPEPSFNRALALAIGTWVLRSSSGATCRRRNG